MDYSTLSEFRRFQAEEACEEAKGYRDIRNVVGVSLIGATALANFADNINTLPPVEQLQFNIAGFGLAISATVAAELKRRKLVKKSALLHENADKLSTLGY